MNRDIIITLCSYLCKGECKPFTPREWSEFASILLEHKKEPVDILKFTKQDYEDIFNYDIDQYNRIKDLIARSASLTFEIEKLEARGIKIVTRADKEYPKVLKHKLEKKCPPLFYYCGDLSILDGNFIGFAGSRSVEDKDIEYTKNAVKYYKEKGYGVVSGGAKGVDSTASKEAIDEGLKAVEFLGDSLIKRIKELWVVEAIQNNQMVVLSQSIPSAPFNVGTAMERNKYIYASSQATVVVKSDYDKGGTWTGATEALKNDYTKVLVWDNKDYKGNQELIKKGAIKLDNDYQEEINELINKIDNKKESIEVKEEPIKKVKVKNLEELYDNHNLFND